MLETARPLIFRLQNIFGLCLRRHLHAGTNASTRAHCVQAVGRHIEKFASGNKQLHMMRAGLPQHLLLGA